MVAGHMSNTTLTNVDIYSALVNEGISHSSRESTLYIMVTPRTRALIANYRYAHTVTLFTNHLDGQLWFDVPYAYAPFWSRREVSKVPVASEPVYRDVTDGDSVQTMTTGYWGKGEY